MTPAGAIRAIPAGLAVDLGWSAERFRKGFAELFEKGLAKGDPGGLIWLPNFIAHNPPENPNVCKAIAKSLAELPECPLFFSIISNLERVMGTLPEGFRKGFAEGLRQGFPKGLPNQEQEQEQDQELEPPPIVPPPGGDADTKPEPKGKQKPHPYQPILDAWSKATGRSLRALNRDRLREIKARLKEGYSQQDLIDAVAGYWRVDWWRAHSPEPATMIRAKNIEQGLEFYRQPARAEARNLEDARAGGRGGDREAQTEAAIAGWRRRLSEEQQ
jgi:hypothetical protein